MGFKSDSKAWIENTWIGFNKNSHLFIIDINLSNGTILKYIFDLNCEAVRYLLCNDHRTNPYNIVLHILFTLKSIAEFLYFIFHRFKENPNKDGF